MKRSSFVLAAMLFFAVSACDTEHYVKVYTNIPQDAGYGLRALHVRVVPLSDPQGGRTKSGLILDESCVLELHVQLQS